MEESKDDENVKVEGEVKDEPGTKPRARKQTREQTPSTELHVYTIPELMKFKKDELVAETVYLEGKYHEIHSFSPHLICDLQNKSKMLDQTCLFLRNTSNASKSSLTGLRI